MWRLKIAEGGGNPLLHTTNGHVGRQVWEFDPTADDPDEVAAVDAARRDFTSRRHHMKNSSDLLMRMQFSRSNGLKVNLPPIKLDQQHGYATEADVLVSLKKGKRDPACLHRAAKVLINFQLEGGEFPQQDIVGATNHNLMLTYAQFRNIFPIWALGEYYRRVLLTV